MSNFIHLDSSYRDREDYPNPADFTVNVANMQTGWYREARRVRAVASTQPRVLEAVTSLNIVDLMIPYYDSFTSEPVLYMDIHSENENDTPLIATMNASVNTARFVLNFQYIQYSRSTLATIATATRAANVVTITTVLPNNFTVNSTVVISGVVGVTNFNGIFTITSIISPTEFTYAQVDVGDLTGTAGTASIPDTPTWIHYGTRMEQVMRFSRHKPLVCRIFNRDGTTIPIIDNAIPNSPNPLKQVYITMEVTPYIRDNDFSNHLINVSSD
jgi:hypothetical protein